MNFREGTRRLALLLGVVGTIAGGFTSFIQLQAARHQREEHIRFEFVTSRIDQLGKAVQKAYPAYNDVDSGNLGWKVLGKYPQFWPWVSGRSMQQPELPKPWDVDAAQQTQQSDPWEQTANQGDWRIWGIKTPDGQTLYPTPAPTMKSYFLIALLPLLGFFIPWSAVRAIGWVGAGFFQPGK